MRAIARSIQPRPLLAPQALELAPLLAPEGAMSLSLLIGRPANVGDRIGMAGIQRADAAVGRRKYAVARDISRRDMIAPWTAEAMMAGVHVRRVYAPAAHDEGRRVLVDRVWPRGLSKEDLRGVLWLKEVGPSTELRKWFGHKPERWEEFRRRYHAELERNPALGTLRDLAKGGPVTLLFGAHDEQHNNAVALAELLQRSRS